MENLLAVGRYWCRLLPQARQELAHWRSRARLVDDPDVRRVAVGKLERERTNIESAAFFALLAGPDWRQALRRIVAFQLAYELLDGLNEAHPALEDGLRLHSALIEAVGGPRSGHGGGAYLQEPVDACRALTVPSQALTEAVCRVGEAQAQNHAETGLRIWAEAFAPRLLWWEAASAGISSLGILAMLSSPPGHHPQILDAYLEIDALGALLDALVDLPADRLDGNHNWLDHYDSEHHAAQRLSLLADNAQRAVSRLPQAAIHRMLLAGLLAHNLAPEGEHFPLVRQRLEAKPWVGLGVRVLRSIHGTVPRG